MLPRPFGERAGERGTREETSVLRDAPTPALPPRGEGGIRGKPADLGRQHMGRGCLVFVGASLLAMGVGLEGLCGQVHGVCVPELQPSHKD